MSSIITVQSSRFLTFYSCITKDFGNCFSFTGNNWEAIRRAYYDTPLVNSVSGVTMSALHELEYLKVVRLNPRF